MFFKEVYINQVCQLFVNSIEVIYIDANIYYSYLVRVRKFRLNGVLLFALTLVVPSRRVHLSSLHLQIRINLKEYILCNFIKLIIEVLSKKGKTTRMILLLLV